MMNGTTNVENESKWVSLESLVCSTFFKDRSIHSSNKHICNSNRIKLVFYYKKDSSFVLRTIPCDVEFKIILLVEVFPVFFGKMDEKS